MIKILRKYYPNLYSFLKVINNYRKNNLLKNVFKTNHSKNALLSYIISPFLDSNNFNHTNFFEARAWAEILNELGYKVDVMEYNSPKTYSLNKYNLICGFGEVFEKIVKSKNQKIIHYGTGFNNIVSNTNTLKRLLDVYDKKGVFIKDSIRYNSNTWRFQTLISDSIISLGNNVSSKTYKDYFKGKVFELNSPFFKTVDPTEIYLKKNKSCLTKFLWFGSNGAIHKGLDLLLDYFSKNNHFELHVCGLSIEEREFSKVFKTELESPNIYNHGFVNLESKVFIELLKMCGFVIFPSCSEGGSPSLLTIVGNGGLFPIHTLETSVNFPNEIIIEGFDDKDIESAINKSQNINWDKYLNFAKLNSDYVNKNHNPEVYKKNLKQILKNIIDE